jgi:hypothetical protein
VRTIIPVDELVIEADVIHLNDGTVLCELEIETEDINTAKQTIQQRLRHLSIPIKYPNITKKGMAMKLPSHLLQSEKLGAKTHSI